MWFTGHDALPLLLNCGEESVSRLDIDPLAPLPLLLRIPFTLGPLVPVDMPSAEAYDFVVEVGVYNLDESDVGIIEVIKRPFDGL